MGYLSLTGDAARDVDAVEAWLSADDPEPVVIATSGSSGAPKQVVVGGVVVYEIKDIVATMGRNWDVADTINDITMVAIHCRA